MTLAYSVIVSPGLAIIQFAGLYVLGIGGAGNCSDVGWLTAICLVVVTPVVLTVYVTVAVRVKKPSLIDWFSNLKLFIFALKLIEKPF